MNLINDKKFVKELQKRFDKNQVYYHCGYCGGIFSDKARTKKIFDLKTVFGKKEIPSTVFNENEYTITTSVCPKCLPKYRKAQGLD